MDLSEYWTGLASWSTHPAAGCQDAQNVLEDTAVASPVDDELERLPPLYATWMKACLGRAVPRETRADCAACPMLQEPPEVPGTIRFHPATKCCTFLPDLPNYLVGALLASDDPRDAEGASRLRARIADGVGVSPLGVLRTVAYDTMSAFSSLEFGTDPRLVCPYYRADDGGSCTIWAHRNCVCGTWFCRFERGASGKTAWNAMCNLLRSVEESLARWCLVELDFEPAALERMFGWHKPSPEPPLPEILYISEPEELPASKVDWGSWAGREEDFYRACAAAVAELAWEDVVAACGVRVRIRALLARREWARALSEAPPEGKLRATRVAPQHMPDGTSILRSYSPRDPVVVPSRLIDLLGQLPPAPIHTLRAHLDVAGVRVSEEVMRWLADFSVLVPAEDDEAG